MSRQYIIIGILFLLVSCGKTPPQRPSFKGQKRVDSVAVQMLTMNQQMAQEADLQLLHYVDEQYALMEDNVWVKGLAGEMSHGDSIRYQSLILKENDYISLSAEIYDLKGQHLSSHQSDAKVGRVDEIVAIVDRISQMKRGDSISMIAPWYVAFGSAGDKDVPPYENVRIELKIK